MLDPQTSYLLEADAKIILNRALLNKEVNAFGLDGSGKYGTSYTAKHFEISNVSAVIDIYSDINDPFVYVPLTLTGYNSNDNGHIVTDNNLKISLNRLFSEHSIDENCWDWADMNQQFSNGFTIRVNLASLLEW